ncbi:conserved hypothetical protein [Ricinus communis]|uniref:Uncharacterized protein n=1 Tax=Ricinus communis TaxID=3988 RepID=B9SB90_RICCO|nr:conserved hypothetical protein [Ricinus communis]
MARLKFKGGIGFRTWRNSTWPFCVNSLGSWSGTPMPFGLNLLRQCIIPTGPFSLLLMEVDLLRLGLAC